MDNLDKFFDRAFEPLRKRGVAHEVWEARPYVPYFGRSHPLHATGTIQRELADYALTPGQTSTLVRFANDARDADGRKGFGDGLLMHKHPFPGEAAILPQLRPHHPLYTGGVTRHRHDKAFANRPDRLERHLSDPSTDAEHIGIGATDWHTHDNLAKYLITPKAKEDVWHDHATDPAFDGPRGYEKMRAHINAEHHGDDVLGMHKHRRAARSQHVADRLDIHPWAVELLKRAERVYFAFEGTPKADAILTRILQTGESASVFNVPSVTLWKAPELKRVAARELADRLVVIVADADYHDNEQVVRQALLCRSYLEDCGVTACVAAPPNDRDAAGELAYKGVDDFLAAGGDLDDLVVLDRTAKFSLALHANSAGVVSGPVSSLMRIMGVARNAERVADEIDRYVARGLIDLDGSLELERGEWSGMLGWKQTPTLTINNNLRYRERFVRLADYVPAATPLRYLDIWKVAMDYYGESPLHDQLARSRKAIEQHFGVTQSTVARDQLVSAAAEHLRVMHVYQLQKAAALGCPVEWLAKQYRESPQSIRAKLKKDPDLESLWTRLDGFSGRERRILADALWVAMDSNNERLTGVPLASVAEAALANRAA